VKHPAGFSAFGSKGEESLHNWRPVLHWDFRQKPQGGNFPCEANVFEAIDGSGGGLEEVLLVHSPKVLNNKKHSLFEKGNPL